MNICRERATHRYDDEHRTTATCLDCGVVRTVVRGRRKRRPKVIYRQPAKPA